MAAMRVARNTTRLYFAFSLMVNIVVLIIFFLPSNETHTFLRDTAWSKLEHYGMVRVGGRATLSQSAMGNQRGCGLCDMDQELCDELGDDALARATGYAGTNKRLRRALAKMRRGDPFTIGVVGGSVSKGQGLANPNGDNAISERNMHRMIFDRLNSLLPSSATNEVALQESGRSLGKNSFINGAQGGMGTDYFSLCFNEHIPDDVDLVLVEFGINDEVQLKNMDSYELLVRGLLDLPSKPAVLNLHFQYMAGGGDLHNGLAQFYDIPYISLRNVLLPQVLQNTSMIREVFLVKGGEPNNVTDVLDNVDLRHLSPLGHELFGRIAIAYIDSQLCEMDKIEAGLDVEASEDIEALYSVDPLPRARLMSKFDTHSVFPTLKPECFSTNAQKHKLKPLEQTGWREWELNGKKYIVADAPGSKISFKFSTNLGMVQLHYLRSYQYRLGSADCWVDGDDRHKVQLDGYWKEPFNIGKAATIKSDLEPGEHILHCELLDSTNDPDGGKEFRIISVMSI